MIKNLPNKNGLLNLLISFCIILASTCAGILALAELYGLNCSYVIVLTFAVVFSGISAVIMNLKKGAVFAAGGYVLLQALCLLLFWKELSSQGNYIFARFTELYNAYNPTAPIGEVIAVTNTADYILVYICSFCTLWTGLLYIKGRSALLASIPYLLVMLSGMLIGKFPPISYMIIYILSFTAIRVLDNKDNFTRHISSIAAGVISLIVIIAAIGIFLPPTYEFAKKNMDKLRAQQEKLVEKYNEGSANPISDLINDNLLRTSKLQNENPNFTGKTQFTVQTDSSPQGVLYLKGFSGGLYNGNAWEITDDSTSLLSKIGSGDSGTVTELWEQPYKLIESTGTAGSKINLYGLGSNIPTALAPYNCAVPTGITLYGDSYLKKTSDTAAFFGYPYYSADFTPQDGSAIEAAYRDYVKNTYMSVPDSQSLFDLCEPAQGLSTEEKISFVRSTLWKMCTYSLDVTPIDEGTDYIEHFLFTQKKGFCQHFASAGTIMMRILGVPSRYATGYAVGSGYFKGDGTVYTADVPDEFGHAWCEIYVDGLGWEPVEFTPPDAAALASIAENTEEQPVAAQTPTPTPEPTPETTPTPEATPTPSAAAPTPEPFPGNNVPAKVDYKLLIILVIGVLLITAIALYIRFFRKSDLLTPISLQRFSVKYLRMVEFVLGRKPNITDKEFILTSSLSIDDSDKNAIIALFERLSFTNYKGTPQDCSFILNLYKKTRAQLKPKLNPIRKFIFTFVKFY